MTDATDPREAAKALMGLTSAADASEEAGTTPAQNDVSVAPHSSGVLGPRPTAPAPASPETPAASATAGLSEETGRELVRLLTEYGPVLNALGSALQTHVEQLTTHGEALTAGSEQLTTLGGQLTTCGEQLTAHGKQLADSVQQSGASASGESTLWPPQLPVPPRYDRKLVELLIQQISTGAFVTREVLLDDTNPAHATELASLRELAEMQSRRNDDIDSSEGAITASVDETMRRIRVARPLNLPPGDSGDGPDDGTPPPPGAGASSTLTTRTYVPPASRLEEAALRYLMKQPTQNGAFTGTLADLKGGFRPYLRDVSPDLVGEHRDSLAEALEATLRRLHRERQITELPEGMANREVGYGFLDADYDRSYLRGRPVAGFPGEDYGYEPWVPAPAPEPMSEVKSGSVDNLSALDQIEDESTRTAARELAADWVGDKTKAIWDKSEEYKDRFPELQQAFAVVALAVYNYRWTPAGRRHGSFKNVLVGFLKAAKLEAKEAMEEAGVKRDIMVRMLDSGRGDTVSYVEAIAYWAYETYNK